MSRTRSHPNFYQAELIIERLVRCGSAMFFVAPGSRSSPLALAVGRIAHERAIVHFDERGLAFAAIGYARATRTPAVLICTSGTAVANFLPAVVEASLSAIPLIVLTADRPPELHDRGANQTIRQRDIFGDFVRWKTELEPPSSELKPATVIETITTAIQYATGSPAGPVHINCPYREPLAPIAEEAPLPYSTDGHAVSVAHTPPMDSREMSSSDKEWLRERIESAKSGLIVVGRLDSEAEAVSAAVFANATGWPVVADVSSHLRLNRKCHALCGHFDLMLLNDAFAKAVDAEMAVHIGGEFVSKRLLEHFGQYRPAEYVHISADPRRRDPANCVTRKITVNIAELSGYSGKTEADGSGNSHFSSLNSRIAGLIADRVDNSAILSEIGVARAVVANAPKMSALFVSSSLPIRLVDSYAPVTDASIFMASNRGASGIDGTIASAVGFARGSSRSTTLLIGDLAFLHDLNSLAMVREAGVPFVIVLINNNGGGIFHMLPIADKNPCFEKFWGTPHGLSFGTIAATFGLNYVRPDTMTAFHSAFTTAHDSSQPTLIEVGTSREETAGLIRRLQNDIKALTD